MKRKNILFKIENGIGLITINRPDQLNALNNNTIEVCYTEAHKGAAVGCSILKRIKK